MSIDSNTPLHHLHPSWPDTPAEPGDRGDDVRAAFEALEGAPAVRREQVDQLKCQVEDGSFQVDARAIAEKLFRG